MHAQLHVTTELLAGAIRVLCRFKLETSVRQFVTDPRLEEKTEIQFTY
jgi:hypothetical protein